MLEKLSAKVVDFLDLHKCVWVANTVVGLSNGLDDPLCESEYRVTSRLVTGIADELFLSGQGEERLRLLRICMLGARADGVAQLIAASAVGSRPMPDPAIAASRGILDVSREDIGKIYLERMANQYGPDVHLDRIDLNFSYGPAFHDWGLFLKNGPWVTDRDLQRNFWMRYIDSPERMALFTRYAVSPFYVGPHHWNPNIDPENILQKNDIRNLAFRFPPYQDVLALSTLRELLGSDFPSETFDIGASGQPQI